MGREIECRATFDGASGNGRALLESNEILFRGTPRFRVRFDEIRTLTARGGKLSVETPTGKAVLELGQAEAELWIAKIKTPRGLMDKLGVRPDSRIALVGVDDAALRKELRDRASDVAEGTATRDRDVVLWGLADKRALAQIEKLRRCLQPAGALWAVWPKGRKELREDDVRAAARAAGLVDVKVASVSETLSGLKLVIPVKDRKKTKEQR